MIYDLITAYQKLLIDVDKLDFKVKTMPNMDIWNEVDLSLNRMRDKEAARYRNKLNDDSFGALDRPIPTIKTCAYCGSQRSNLENCKSCGASLTKETTTPKTKNSNFWTGFWPFG